MIRCDGKKTVICGSTIDILQDFVNVTRAVRNALTNNINEEVADKLITLCGREAYYEDGSTLEEIGKVLLEAAKQN